MSARQAGSSERNVNTSTSPLPGEHPLARHPAVLVGQELDQAVLQRRAGREVDVPALGGDDLVAVVGRRPEQKGLPEPGARAQHGDRPVRDRRVRRPARQLVGADRGHAQRGGAEVVDQRDARSIPRRCDSVRPSTTQGRLVARQMLFSIGPAMPKQALSRPWRDGADLARPRRPGTPPRSRPATRRPPTDRSARRAGASPRTPGGGHVVDRQPRVGAADVTCQDRHVGAVIS